MICAEPLDLGDADKVRHGVYPHVQLPQLAQDASAEGYLSPEVVSGLTPKAMLQPRSAALVALLADACRGWDAIVVGEDRIVPHLPALYLLLTGPAGRTRRRRTRRGTDVRYQAAEDVICYLREEQITLTYDPAAETLHACTGEAAQTITLKAG
jgi:hypothetical protein